MNKILDKIKNVPIGVKAAAVYTLASVFSKGLAIITVPIFTRIMSTSEIGVVNLYNSWNSMLNAVVTLSLTSGGYSAALKEFGKERDQYQSSIMCSPFEDGIVNGTGFYRLNIRFFSRSCSRYLK